jgi:hypothetical protein
MHTITEIHVGEPQVTEFGTYQDITFRMKDGSTHHVSAFFDHGHETVALPSTEKASA